MKKIMFVTFLFSSVFAGAQTREQKITTAMKAFHQALVQKDTKAIDQQTDKALSYGHSNGWIETKRDLINDLETGLISYHSFKEDSVKVAQSGDAAHIRFIADINSTLRGNNTNNHIKVMEVWIKKGDKWVLFARQAVR
jgi:hypothetical protein